MIVSLSSGKRLRSDTATRPYNKNVGIRIRKVTRLAQRKTVRLEK
jgi:hypothetical protein